MPASAAIWPRLLPWSSSSSAYSIYFRSEPVALAYGRDTENEAHRNDTDSATA